MGSIKLSILICTLSSREHYLQRLLSVLNPQIVDAVEVLIEADGGDISIGAKRQRLLERATGEYIVFIDDDDLIPEYYVADVLLAVASKPDVVGFYADRYTYTDTDEEPVEGGISAYTCQHHEWKTTPYSKLTIDGIARAAMPLYERTPCHITPVRLELALAVGFADLDHGEDEDFAMRLLPLVQSEVFIPRIMYSYLFRSTQQREGETTHQQIVQEHERAKAHAFIALLCGAKLSVEERG